MSADPAFPRGLASALERLRPEYPGELARKQALVEACASEMSGEELSALDEQGRSILLLAAEHSNLFGARLCGLMIERGADPRASEASWPREMTSRIRDAMGIPERVPYTAVDAALFETIDGSKSMAYPGLPALSKALLAGAEARGGFGWESWRSWWRSQALGLLTFRSTSVAFAEGAKKALALAGTRPGSLLDLGEELDFVAARAKESPGVGVRLLATVREVSALMEEHDLNSALSGASRPGSGRRL